MGSMPALRCGRAALFSYRQRRLPNESLRTQRLRCRQRASAGQLISSAMRSNMQASGRQNTPGYVRPLTGIRALAALLVLGIHTEQNVPAGLDVLLPFFTRGYLGVDLFFVLSGYIITYVYQA